MLNAVAQMLLFQLAGEVLARGPGAALQNTASQLLQHLSLLFIPAGTGIVLHWHRVGSEWWPLLVTLTVSTAVTLAVTALTMKLVQHLRRGGS